jgi:hypothetical protein
MHPLILLCPFSDELIFWDSSGKDYRIYWEVGRPEMIVKKMDCEDEAGGEEGLIRMDDGCHVQYPSGQEDAEEASKPEHQACQANSEHSPEDGQEIEFLLISPAVKPGHWPSIEEPAYHPNNIFCILPPREERLWAK